MKNLIKILILTLFIVSCDTQKKENITESKTVKQIDSYSFEGVKIYKNNGSNKRHLSQTGYNYGLKWQCVEFVKRFYYKKFNHKMPNTYGHANSFYNLSVKSGNLNKDRDLIQIKYTGLNYPSKYDIIVFDYGDLYGHVAIVTKVYKDGSIEVAQQNTYKSRARIKLNKNVLGWLRLENK